MSIYTCSRLNAKPSLVCATDETKLWLSPSAKQRTTCVPGFAYAPFLVSLKKPSFICQSG